jgi:hypothetical protein
MPRVRLFHWRAEETKPLIAALRAGGYTVDYPGDKANGSWRSLRERPQPVAAVIDLTRLPSHGRYVAAEIRASKSMRQIPIVFVDGDPDKVEAIRKNLPDAVYTSRASLLSALKRVKPLLDPVVPPRMMNRTDRTAAEKLGIKAGARVANFRYPCSRAALREIGRVLHPGGKFSLVVIGQNVKMFNRLYTVGGNLVPAFWGRQVESSVPELIREAGMRVVTDRFVRQGFYPSRVLVAENRTPRNGR